MGMSRAAKMFMTGYRSRNEGNYGEMQNYRNEGNQMEMAEMRRRRDSRGRYAQMENYGNEANGYQNEMRGYRNEMEGYRNEMREAPDPGGLPANSYYQEQNKKEQRDEYPKPHLLPRKQPIGFHTSSEQSEKKRKELDKQTAHEWVESMEGEDEAKWKDMEEVKPFMMQAKFSGNPIEFWAIMNAMYTDYCKVAKRFGVDRPEFFAELAKAWLEDEDAVPNKAAMYYDCIVKH